MQEYNNVFFDFCAANQTRLARYTFQIESYSDIRCYISDFYDNVEYSSYANFKNKYRWPYMSLVWLDE